MSVAVIVTGFLVFARFMGLFRTLPLISAMGVPQHVPVFLAMGMTLIISPLVPVIDGPITSSLLVFGLMSEAMLGALLGLTVLIIFSAISLGAQLAGMQIGMAMANSMNPFTKGQSATLGVLSIWFSGMIFLGIGLHYECLHILVASFEQIPPGTAGLPIGGMWLLVDIIGHSLGLGVQLAGPILALVWLVNVFFALLGRMAPKMNVFFSIGLTANAATGLYTFAVAMPWILIAHTEEMREAVRNMARMVVAVS